MEISSGKLFRYSAIILGFIGVIFIYKNYNPLEFAFPKCPVYYLTGYYCTGCGSQRVLHALSNFDLTTAFNQNILAVLFIFAFVIEFILKLFSLDRFRPYQYIQKNAYASLVILITIIAFTILRNIPSYPFSALAPT